MLYNPLDNRGLYNIYDLWMRSLQPYSDLCANLAKGMNRLSENLDLPVTLPFMSASQKEDLKTILEQMGTGYRRIAGYYYIAYMLTNNYDKPQFNIPEIKINDEYYEISEQVVDYRSFCNLLHFGKINGEGLTQPKILLVAPMAGHHATLLRDTVTSLLPFYDVYITDWKNARDVPLKEGSFDLDDYIEYVISYLLLLGPELHVMAVCQPTVPVLTAIALMSTHNVQKLPRTAILIGGPIDTSKSPTSVNEFATSRGDDWFAFNVICNVPNRFPGALRLVYPGFMQLSGFLSMNLQRHMESLNKAVEDFANKDSQSAFKTVNFYLEYLSPMDLTAEFYMQTIDTVFQEKLLTSGHYKTRGLNVRLQDIKNTAILAIEGSRDDITGAGQTKSVLELCKNLPNSMKKYWLAEDVGHYGLFSGSKFRSSIVPEILEFTAAHNEPEKKNKKPPSEHSAPEIKQ